MPKFLSIIILNYNLTASVRACLHSLADVQAEIIVADNHSPDRSIELLPAEFPSVKFLFLKTNLGFAHGNNAAVRAACGDVLFILNPDTAVFAGSVSMLLTYLNAHPDTGIAAPRLQYEDGRPQFSYNHSMTLWREIAEAFYFQDVLRALWYNRDREKIQRGEPFAVGWVSGAAMLIPRSIYEKVGGFDEDFFLMYEDIDLCDRIRNLGYRIVLVPAAAVVHQDGGIIAKNLTRLVTNRYHARFTYLRKRTSWPVQVSVRFAHIIGLCIRLLLSVFLYRGRARSERLTGYAQSLAVYLGLSKFD